MLKEKLKASIVHLAISALILLAFFAIVFFIWYPSPYAEISGLTYLLLTLIGVDLVLGPLLTFIVFKRNKTTLKFDLAVIAAIQLAALGYGMHAIYLGHPVYVVYAVDRFELIPAVDAFPEQAKYEEFQVSKFGFPKLAYAKLPEDPETRNKILFETLSGLPDIERRPGYYEPLAEYTNQIIARGINPKRLFATSEDSAKLKRFLEKSGAHEQHFAYLPLVGKAKDVVVAVDKKTGKLAGTIDVYPWAKKTKKPTKGEIARN